MRNTDSKRGFYVFIVFLGAITGNLIGDILGTHFQSLNFLKNVYSVGTSQPLFLNMKVIGITFGININVNLVSIIGVFLAIILIRKY